MQTIACLVARANESTKDLIKKFSRKRNRLVICLDECEWLSDPDIIKEFVRNSCAVILISNEPPIHSKALVTLEERPVMEIEFHLYSQGELNKIFYHRASQALRPGAVNKHTVSELSRFSNYNVRAGLQILNFAARETHFKGSKEVTTEDIRFAAQSTRGFTMRCILDNLNPNEKTLFEIVRDNKKIASGSLFGKFRRITNEEVPERTYRHHMSRIKQLGLVKEIGFTKGKVYEIA